jgi:starch-binding outer membrane protein, SusD/RagB family
MQLIKIISAVTVLSLLLSSCTKNALDQKPDATIAEPSTISDFQQLMDGLSGGVLNNAPGLYSYRTLGDYLSDECYVTNTDYASWFINSPLITGIIEWDKNMFSSITSLIEWNNTYKIVLNTNVALEGINAISPTASTQAAWNNVKGTALFIRGQMCYNLAQFWAQPYHAATASTDQGIVLRTGSNADVASVRSSVKDTYNQILSDLLQSVPLLPNTSAENKQVSKVRPSKAAAYGMLARTYLAMGDSVNTFKYADSALQLYSTLMNYNTLTGIANFNAETVYTSMDQSGTIGSTFGFWYIDTNLVKSYDSTDLRKKLFVFYSSYAGGNVFIGDYAANYKFTGIAVDELYLLRAEGSARMGNTSAAMADLNTLLVMRYKTGTFTPRTATDAGNALMQIIAERKKELLFRGCRWTDLRRLNTDSRFATTLSRTLNGATYTLPPNDSRYTLQIPAYVISAANGTITQSP